LQFKNASEFWSQAATVAVFRLVDVLRSVGISQLIGSVGQANVIL